MTGGDTHNEVTGAVISTVVQAGSVGSVTLRLPARVPEALSGLPPGELSFTGRDDDLERLLEALAPEATVGAVAVSGMAGVGKTELAVQVARTALSRGWFPGGVLFVDMFGYDPARRLDAGQALEGFLRAVGVPGEHVPPAVQDRARLWQSLSTVYAEQGRPVLVVVDNVGDTDQARLLLPSHPACRTVLTSRHTLGRLGARLVDVDTLPAAAAVDVLRSAIRIARPEDIRVAGHPSDAAKIAEACGGLPLALQIVAALLADNPRRPLVALAADLADREGRLAELSYGAEAVAAAFDLSYARLPETQARLFRLLSANPGPDISTAATAALAILPEPEARRGLEALARAHLIEPGIEYGRWRMHDLLRLHSAHLAESRPEDRAQAVAELMRYYVTRSKAANAHIEPSVADPAALGFATRDEALAWLDTEFANLAAATHAAFAAGEFAVANEIPRAITEFIDWRRLLNEGTALATLAVDAARELGDPRAEASALIGLGSTLSELRRFEESIRALQEASSIYGELGDRRGEANTLNNVSNALQGLRRFDESQTALQRAVRIYRDIGDRAGEAIALGNLGNVARHIRRFKEAVAAHRQAAEIHRELGFRYGEGMALHNLSAVLIETRQFDESATAARSAAEICREVGARPTEGQALDNLGLALSGSGRREEAISAHRQAAEIHREVGDNHAEASAILNLGGAVVMIGRLEEGVALLRESVRMFRDAGDRHREGDAWESLGTALQRTEDFAAAVSAHRTAVENFRGTDDRHAEAGALANLGGALTALDRAGEAVEDLQRAAEIFHRLRDRLGESLALSSLGTALFRLGRLQESYDAYLRSVEISDELGESADKADNCDNVGLVLSELGDHRKAVIAHRRAVEIFRELGDSSSEASALANLGNALMQGEFQGSVDAYEDALRLYIELDDRAGEATALAGLGHALFDLERWQDAITRFESALAIYRELTDREGEAFVLNGIGVALEQLNRAAEAVTAYEGALRLCRELGDRDGEALALENLGDALTTAGREGEARTAWQQAERIRRELESAG